MTWWHRLFRRRKNEEELEKELRFHLDQHTADLVAQGLDPEEARRLARLALGGPEQVKEQCRDARGTRGLEDMLQDLRYGMRMLLNKPGFTLIAVITLAAGIAANTTIFSVADALILRPFRFPQQERLVMVWERRPRKTALLAAGLRPAISTIGVNRTRASNSLLPLMGEASI